MIERLLSLAERGVLPDALIRRGIRMLDRSRLRMESEGGPDAQSQRKAELIRQLSEGPIARFTDEANQQHYEVPTSLFRHILGPRLKYSCCTWPPEVSDLASAEEAALAQVCRRAEISDGQRILDLGCGWGSLSLWLAEKYPASRITAVSNSRTQAMHIEEACRQRKLTNLEVFTADVNTFEPEETFDRVCSIEMFEHMNNLRLLLERVAGWLNPEGKLFVHVFSHRTYAYRFEIRGSADWMTKYFFTGGLMPSDDLLLHFQDRLAIEGHWMLDGRHYSRTCRAWLENLDRARSEVLPILAEAYGEDPQRWFQRWRLFLWAGIELWGFQGGNEWIVSHYRFRKRGPVQGGQE